MQIGSITVRNRFIMGPMDMSWQKDDVGAFKEEAIPYFVERAKGGFGTIITGANLVDEDVDPILTQMSGKRVFPLFKDRFLETAKKLTAAVGEYDTKMFLEIGFGIGRNYPMIKAPSASPAFKYPNMLSTPLTRKEIRMKRDAIIEAAAIAQEGGFAGVDLHSLHWGYLLDQFVLSITNQRTDEYGGSLENRLRLVRESVEGIHRECGNDFPVIVGLGVKSFIKALNKASLFGEDEAGRTIEESVEIVKQLEQMGIAAIMTDLGVYDSFYYACPPSYMPKGHGLEYYKPIKEAVNIPVLARSRMGSAEVCISALENGQADGVVLARPALADPEFPNKIASGNADAIRPCIGCNMGCMSAVVLPACRPALPQLNAATM